MTDDGFPVTTVPEETLAALLAEFRPDWTLQSADRAAEGTDIVYHVTAATPEGERRAVLKAADFLDAAAFRIEPHLLRAVADRTDVPVPRVLGAVDEERPDLPTPAFLMTECDGVVLEGRPDALSADALRRVVTDAGHNLAAVHAAITFDGPGQVVPAADSADHVAVDPADGTWDETLADAIDASLAHVADDERFADLAEPIREAVADLRPARTPPRYSLLHLDYRLGNLLVDPVTGATEAVLDWGNPAVGDPLHDLVRTEFYLADMDALPAELRADLRDRLWDAYAAERSLAPAPASEALSRLDARLVAMRWVDEWNAEAGPAEKERVVDGHREWIEGFLADPLAVTRTGP